ncbi:MAG: universal stress protein, partial [Betaproteobacteria bacterium]|nr:universal stress protein [Betaproteobacteria bacterium]
RVADAIVADAREWGADLIVIGSHGRSGVRHLLLGSVAEGVARASTIPVLIVHPQHQAAP